MNKILKSSKARCGSVLLACSTLAMQASAELSTAEAAVFTDLQTKATDYTAPVITTVVAFLVLGITVKLIKRYGNKAV